MTVVDADLLLAVRNVLELVVAGDYEELASLTNRIRLSEEEISRAIKTYGRKLVMPPSEAFLLLDIVEVEGARPCKWSVVMPLWTLEEGRSDLSLMLTLIRRRHGFDIELDDIRVL